MVQDSKSPQPAKPDRPQRPARSQAVPKAMGIVGLSAAVKSSRLPAAQKRRSPVQLQQTLIPILLALGVMLCGIGAVQWVVDPEYPFSARQMRLCAIVLPVVGVALLGVAVMTMRWVKRKISG